MISTGLGIGYLGKGAGTFAAAVTCICWYRFQAGDAYPNLLTLIITLMVLVQGLRSADVVEGIWGKDHQRVVIDEIAGMCITLLCIPVRADYILLGFVFFRFFDIMKPFFIKRMEKLPGGWGVMADDVLAGAYSNLLLQLIIALKLL